MRIGAGGIVVTPVAVRHQLVNPGPDRLVTFHMYSPPMQTPMSGPLLDRRHVVAAMSAVTENAHEGS
jgi:hypothetical protein